MSSKTLESNRETPMTSHPQSGLLLQMSQPRGSKTKEEEEYEDAQGQQGLQGHGKKMASSKQPSTKNGRHERIVKVQGGHIVRSIARKDRHSKVYTSKGSRDRRFRLSAQTAIQFYDVQDRLGYERPSKAIDWLMKKAKASIDALDESSKTQKPMLQHQGRHSEPETVENHQQFGPSNMNNLSKEPVLDYGEGALNSACYFSEANFLEMGWLQSLMAWNHNAGDAGEGCSFNSSHVSLNS